MRALHTVIMFFVGILYYFLLRMPGHRLSKTGASLLVGGGLNNLLDRYTKGYVVDYVKFNFGSIPSMTAQGPPPLKLTG